jgi:hypothetical protein
MVNHTSHGEPVAPPLEGRATRWFVYLNAPVSRLAAVIDLGPAVAGSPEEVAAIAERMRPGNGTSVLEYVRDPDRAIPIPIPGVTSGAARQSGSYWRFSSMYG